MDILTIQRSLTVLEDRYRELREIGDHLRQAMEAEVAQAKGEREALAQEKMALVDANEALALERDNMVRERDEAVEASEALKQQLAAQISASQQVHQAHGEQVARVHALEIEVAQAKGEREALAQEKMALVDANEALTMERDNMARERDEAVQASKELKQQLAAQNAWLKALDEALLRLRDVAQSTPVQC